MGRTPDILAVLRLIDDNMLDWHTEFFFCSFSESLKHLLDM